MNHLTRTTIVCLCWICNNPAEEAEMRAHHDALGDQLEFEKEFERFAKPTAAGEEYCQNVLVYTTIERAILHHGELGTLLEQYIDEQVYPDAEADLERITTELNYTSS